MKLAYLITHPDVIVDPNVPVPQWPLSARGRERMQQMLYQPWVATITAVYSSAEQKAIDGAHILAEGDAGIEPAPEQVWRCAHLAGCTERHVSVQAPAHHLVSIQFAGGVYSNRICKASLPRRTLVCRWHPKAP